jgi:hypothetical protein
MSDTLEIGGKHFELKPLNLKSLKKLAEKGYLQKLSSMNSGLLEADQLEAVIQTVAIALQRSYPDVTAEWLEDVIEVQELSGVLNAILVASGFKSADSKRESL